MSDRGKETRAFLAIPPDPAWSESASRLLREMRPSAPAAAWTKPPSWHVTIRFMGAVGPEKLDAFSSGIAAAASAAPGGRLILVGKGAAVFPRGRPARVLGVALEPAEGRRTLSALVNAVEEAGREIGLPEENRPFRPHVTLARIRERWPSVAVERFRELVSGWPFPPWNADQCVLYASRFERNGAVHTPLGAWLFGGRPAQRTA